jgi:hypothetical protein
MKAQGSTNQTIGLVWGWHSLTPDAPLDNPATPNGTKRVIVMLTDGLNTENRWTTNTSSIDARTKLVCDGIKADDITVYTVQVKGNGDPTSSILENCASDPEKFFALDSGDQIVTTFESIGTALASVRLSR